MHSLPQSTMKIRKVSNLARNEFEELYRNKKPVIITDLTEKWPLFSENAFDSKDALKLCFQQNLSTVEKAFVAHDNVHFLAQNIVDEVEMNLESVIDRMFQDPDASDCRRIYLRAPLYADISKRIALPGHLLRDGEDFSHDLNGTWLGSAGNITPLHIDVWHGVLVQVTGRKSVVLFNPDDTPFLYQNSNALSNNHTCNVNLKDAKTRAHKDKFPNFEEASPYHDVLLPGQALYIPPCWWHDVVSLDPCVSLTLRWNVGTMEKIHACAFK